jgi:hypothetical protein
VLRCPRPVARIFVESVLTSYRVRARRDRIEEAQCGPISFVQGFGSLNLPYHFHLVALDGVFARDAGRRLLFHPAGRRRRIWTPSLRMLRDA